MTKFIAILKNKKIGELTDGLLQLHVDHLKKKVALGEIQLCGPFKDNDGAFQLINASCYETAKTILESDPFIREGYYQSYELSEIIEANEENDWLMKNEQTQRNMKGA